MKLASQTLAALVFPALVLVSSACSVDTRSDEYRCTNNNDCEDGRACEGGWCVVVPCPLTCSRCLADGTCVMDCSDAQACQDTVVCPPGRRCQVQCGGGQSCAGGVDCTEATACVINCGGTSACAGALVCGSGECAVVCNGTDSCQDSVDCSQSCACETSCSGTNACGPDHLCPSGGNCALGGTCRSNSAGCDLC